MRLILWWTFLNVWLRRSICATLILSGVILLVVGAGRVWLVPWFCGFLLLAFSGRRAEGPVDEAMRQVYAADAHLRWWRRRPQRALALLEPLRDLRRPEDPAALRSYDVVMGMICALTADCHRELGDHEEAARWYRRAAESPEFTGFAPFYADMVLRHEMSGEYEFALECLERARAKWREYPLLLKVFGYVISGWWFDPEGWRLIFTEHRMPGRLRARMRESGAAETGGQT